MKKNFAILIVVLIVVAIVVFVKFKNLQMDKQEIAKFNSQYELYNADDLNGLDITTVINKAISNNEKYELQKDENGYYILDDEYSVEILVKMYINEKTYPMERIESLGMSSFAAYFGEVGFKCTDVKYHEKTGRIASMIFEATEE